MSEWLDDQKQSINSIRQLLQERIEKANPSLNQRPNKLIVSKLKHFDFEKNGTFIIISDALSLLVSLVFL